VRGMVVAPSGVRPFVVDVKRQPIHVVPPLRPGEAAQVDVKADITFRGTANIEQYPLKKPLAFANGNVRIGKSAVMTDISVTGDRVRGTVSLWYTALMRAELACSDLDIGEVPDKPIHPRVAEGQTTWLTSVEEAAFVPLWQKPGEGEILEVSSSLMWTAKGPTEHGYTFVSTTFTDGSVISGWLHAPVEEGGIGFGDGISLCGEGTIGHGVGHGYYEGHGVVPAGTPVRAWSGGPVWATVSRDLPVDVAFEPADAVVELHADGIEPYFGTPEEARAAEKKGQPAPGIFVDRGSVRFTRLKYVD
jgi:hypothetical protein